MRRAFLAIAAIVFLPIVFCNAWIIMSTHSRLYSDISNLPGHNVGLVLGTSKYVKTGVENLHFKNRISAAAKLYHLGKVKHLIVSGDNAEKWHDEPTDMLQALLEHNVPESAITKDYAGFRTLDSVVRAKKVFGQNKFVIVSDAFHNYRALFLSDHHDIEAIALCSKNVPLKQSYKVKSREIAARVKAVLDIYILKTEPKVLGEPVEIRIQ